MRMSLRLRLGLAGALAIICALALSAFGLSQLFGAHVERRAIAEMQVQLDQVLAGLEQGADGLTLVRQPADPRFSQPYGGLYWQIAGPTGMERSRSLWDAALDLPDDTFGTGEVHVHRLTGPQDAPLLVLERSVVLSQRLGGEVARVAIGMAVAELDAAQRAFMADLSPYLAVLALVLIVAGWAQLWVGLRPLQGLGARVAALRAGQSERMGHNWPAEVHPVATEIDALLNARAAETTRARARAADLAHGLKTPLQALMGEAARLRLAGESARAEAIEDTARAMRRTVDRELARARTASRAADTFADIRHVAERLLAVLRRTPEGDGLEWRVDIPKGLCVALHEADLSEALGALAENAARHARSGVSISARAQDGRVFVQVTDDGLGIPSHRRTALIARHGRADESGTGLGLSIAAEIAEAAGGNLTLSDASPGLTATLVLP